MYKYYCLVAASFTIWFSNARKAGTLSSSPEMCIKRREHFNNAFSNYISSTRRVSSVSVKTEVWFPTKADILSAPSRSDRPWDLSRLFSTGARIRLPDVKRPEHEVDHSSPSLGHGQECVILYLHYYHSPIRLRSVVPGQREQNIPELKPPFFLPVMWNSWGRLISIAILKTISSL
jgi:hypothetical protein